MSQVSGQFRGGTGEPVVLVHGGASSWSAWRDVIPHLTTHHDVLAPTLAGHAGGTPLGPGLAGRMTIDAYADSVEEAMDRAGFATAHIAGNSLGGWVSMELARRGRARSVVAISPAGGWTDRPSRERVRRYFRAVRLQLRLGRPLAPLMMRCGLVRRLGLRDIAEHGDRLTAAAAIELVELALAYDMDRMIELLEPSLAAFPDPGVPVLLAWAGEDRLLPMPTYSDPWLAAVPHAEFRVLPGVGHVPMYDDPRLVANVIRAWATSPTALPHGTGNSLPQGEDAVPEPS